MYRLASAILCLLFIAATSSVTAQSTFESRLKAKASKGANLYGTVECGGVPMQDVLVSDGYSIVRTDRNGVYCIKSPKTQGLVFITIPSGYMTDVDDGAVPQVWATTGNDISAVERHDFSLHREDNDRHVMIGMTDIHLANQYDDIRQFTEVCMPQIRREVERFEKEGYKVYTLNAGDSSFDIYWYDNLYDISDFKQTLRDVRYPTPMFTVMGNHDNDPSVPAGENTDFLAAAKFRECFGPTYYSANIGRIHYVMMDDLVYLNEPGGKKAMNVAGARNRDSMFTTEELEWLRKDLSFVPAETPVVLVVHCPLITYKGMTKNIVTRMKKGESLSPEEGLKIYEVLKGHREVHVVSGHIHKNLCCRGADDTSAYPIGNIIDHNMAALSPNFWRTPTYGSQNLGADGGPSGFMVFPVDGDRITWYFNAIGSEPDVQFRSFDLNSVRKEYSGRTELAAFAMHYSPRVTDYSKVEDNQVLVNVWNWDTAWKVRILENGKDLEVRRVSRENPQYTWSYQVPRYMWQLRWERQKGPKERNDHMFIAQASSPDSTLEIIVTDGCGREYREMMTRPKAFTKQSR